MNRNDYKVGMKIGLKEQDRSLGLGEYCVTVENLKTKIVWMRRHTSYEDMNREYQLIRLYPWQAKDFDSYEIVYCPQCNSDKVTSLIGSNCSICGRSRSEIVRQLFYEMDCERDPKKRNESKG